MIVRTESGRRLTIPIHHTVFAPVGQYRQGDRVDPETVEVAPGRPSLLRTGDRIIIDNKVEVVAEVATV